MWKFIKDLFGVKETVTEPVAPYKIEAPVANLENGDTDAPEWLTKAPDVAPIAVVLKEVVKVKTLTPVATPKVTAPKRVAKVKAPVETPAKSKPKAAAITPASKAKTRRGPTKPKV